MSTERDATRIVRSWLEEGVTALPDRVLDLVLDEIPTTPQRRPWWPSRRFAHVNKYAQAAIVAVAVLVVAVVAYRLLPGVSGPGGQTSASAVPSASPAALASGSFISHGAQIELYASGAGSNVTGSMTATDVGGDVIGSFTVDLACTRVTNSGLILIGGLVTDSTNYDDFAPKGGRVAIVLQRGSPVKAFIHAEYPDPPGANCQAFLEGVPDVGDPGFEPSALEPIEGTIELRQSSPAVSAEPSVAADGSLPVGSTHVLWSAPGEVGVAFTISYPGWFGEEGAGMLVKGESFGPPDGAALMVFQLPLYVYGDPCHWSTTLPDAPVTTRDGFIAAMAAQVSGDAASTGEGWKIGDGFGRGMALHVPGDVSTCDAGQFRSWTDDPSQDPDARYQQRPGQIHSIWVGTGQSGDWESNDAVVLFDVVKYASTPPDVVDEVWYALADSATFEMP